jgi:hypothetical protein
MQATLHKPSPSAGIVVDQHLMGECAKDGETGHGRLPDEEECHGKQRRDHERRAHRSGEAGQIPLMSLTAVRAFQTWEKARTRGFATCCIHRTDDRAPACRCDFADAGSDADNAGNVRLSCAVPEAARCVSGLVFQSSLIHEHLPSPTDGRVSPKRLFRRFWVCDVLVADPSVDYNSGTRQHIKRKRQSPHPPLVLLQSVD